MAEKSNEIPLAEGGGSAGFDLNFLAKNLTGVKKEDGTEFEIKAPDEEEVENEENENDEPEKEVPEEVESEDSEGDEEEGDEGSEDSEEEEEPEEVDTGEESEEEEEDSEEGEELDNEDEGSEEEQEIKEFNVFEETDGVFETMDGLKEHAQLLKDNPQLLEMVNFYKSEGDLLPWLQATQINVDDFSDIDVLREKFKSDNDGLGLSESDLNAIFEEDVVSKFNTDEDSDDFEAKSKVAKARLAREAAQARKEIKEAQKEFLLPTKRDVESEIEIKSKESATKLESAKNKLSYQIRKEIKNGEVTIPVDDKGGFVKMKASPKVIDTMVSSLQDVAIFQDAKGNFDIQKMAMISNPKAFVSSVISSSEASGKKKFVDEKLKNRKSPKSKTNPERSKNSSEKVVIGQKDWLKGAKIVKK